MYNRWWAGSYILMLLNHIKCGPGKAEKCLRKVCASFSLKKNKVVKKQLGFYWRKSKKAEEEKMK